MSPGTNGYLTKIFFIIIWITSANRIADAQSLNGLSGYFNTPTAFINGDGALTIGASAFNKKYQIYSGYQNHVWGAFVTFGYIPGLELSARITRKIDAIYTSHVMDRMFSAKIRIIKEGEYIPAFSIGLQNPYSTLESANHFNSTYFVLSKSHSLSKFFSASVTLGRGFDWINAADHEFIGFFGGADFNFHLGFLSASFIIENDALRWNGALRLTVLNHFSILAGVQGMDAFSVGSSFSFNL